MGLCNKSQFNLTILNFSKNAHSQGGNIPFTLIFDLFYFLYSKWNVLNNKGKFVFYAILNSHIYNVEIKNLVR